MGTSSLKWLYSGHTKSTWHSSSVVSAQNGQSRWFSATEKRSLWPFIRETPIRKRASAVLYTLLCITSRYLSHSNIFLKQLHRSNHSLLAKWENHLWQQQSLNPWQFLSFVMNIFSFPTQHPDITKTIVTQEKLDLRHPVPARTVSLLHTTQHFIRFSRVPVQRLLQKSKPVLDTPSGTVYK